MECQIFEKKKISPEILKNIEDFRFPYSLPHRLEELEIDRQYNDQSTFFVVCQNGFIEATVRVIAREDSKEKLPIEFSRQENGAPIIIPPIFPMCEVGGLKINDGLSIKNRYKILHNILLECTSFIFLRKFRRAYLTCTEDKTELYKNKFSFDYFGPVFYGNKKFCALYRDNGFNGTPWIKFN